MTLHITRPANIEVKLGDDDRATIVGLASTFGNTDSYGDVIERGAFEKSIERIRGKGGKIPMLDAHKWDSPIGVWTHFEETPEGLQVEGKLTMSVTRAKEVRDLIIDEAISALSIGFISRKDYIDKERRVRVIEEIDLKEVSPVVFPANPEATIQAVKQAADIETRRDFEEALRAQLGFSRNAAKSIAARGFMTPDLREEAGDPVDFSDLRNAVDQLATSLNV